MRQENDTDAERSRNGSVRDGAAQEPVSGSPGDPSSKAGQLRTGLAASDRLHRVTRRLWPAVAVLPLLLSACEIRQEIRFNPDGSGTASVTVGIDKTCQLPDSVCSERAQRLVGGEGPVANAKADAENLPFRVRIEPFERGFVPPDNQPLSGYTLSFDFAGLEDLEQKVAPGPATQTSALDFRGMTLEPNGQGGFTFTAEVSPAAHLAWGSPEMQGGPDLQLAVVLPGAGKGEHSADIAGDVEGGIRFQWNFEAIEGGGEEWPAQLQASTCSRGACPGTSPLIGAPPSRLRILVVAAIAVAVAAVVLFVLMLRKSGRRPASEFETTRVPMHTRAFVIGVVSVALIILGAVTGVVVGFPVGLALAARFGTGAMFEDLGYAVLGAFVGLLIGAILGSTVGGVLKRRWLGINWDVTRARLERAFEAVIRQVRLRFPTITASSGSWAAGYMRFHVGAAFTRPAHQENEDVVLQFACAPNERMLGPGAKPFFPEATGRDIVRFDIERGTGEELAALDPVLLPADPKSTEYEQAVLEYVERTIVFLEGHKELVFDVLRQAQEGWRPAAQPDRP